MTTFTKIRSQGALFLGLALALVLALPAGAATITIVNNNAAGVGFNDPTPVAPVGGNPGTTLGAQRLNVFNYAANIWGGVLPSAVEILVRAQFTALSCSATSAVLGSAGATTVHREFTGALLPGHWYSQSLANRLAGTDLSVVDPDINANFNLSIDSGCFGPGLVWYYGYDGNEGPNIELLPVVLHELSHGLNFATTTGGSTGNYLAGYPNVYDNTLLDAATGRHWDDPAESAAQRAASAISLNGLVWDGSAADACAQTFLAHRPRLKVNSPVSIAGTYPVQTASFGPPLTVGGVTGDVVLVNDGVGTTTDACEPIINGAALAGKIALIDRGTCTFVIKVKAAQDAGAIAAIIVNNVAAGLPGMGGTDPTIVIPSVGISQATGNAIKANLAGGVNVTLDLDPVYLAGADNSGRPLMYAPNPYASGSSVSHWDVSLTPNALMEPAINSDLHTNLDLTPCLFQDVGWFYGIVATEIAEFSATGRDDGILVRWQFSNPADVAVVTLQRAPNPSGPWEPISTDLSRDGEVTLAMDRNVAAGGTYFYRMEFTDRAGLSRYSPIVSASRGGTYLGPVVLDAPWPNPASKGTTVKFRIGNPEFVRLTVSDAAGRRIRTIQEGMLLAGEYTRRWDGMTDHSTSAPAGMYFISLTTSQGVRTQRVALMN